jgi:hypothetical protein
MASGVSREILQIMPEAPTEQKSTSRLFGRRGLAVCEVGDGGYENGSRVESGDRRNCLLCVENMAPDRNEGSLMFRNSFTANLRIMKG